MCDTQVNAVFKVHPASREILSDDPMEMHACEIPGDPDLMLRLVVEEYARIGLSAADILALAMNPNYTAFYGLRRRFGDEEFRRRVTNIIARCGVIRVTASETEPPSENLVQIALPVN
jgi:hypothetical protein